MLKTKWICLLLAAAMITPAFARKKKDKTDYGVYIAGAAASFSDSLVFFTDIQRVDSASLNSKGMLNGRAQYSRQLKEHLESTQQLQHRTCFVFFNKKKQRLQKEIDKVRRNYQKGGRLTVKEVNGFQFRKAE